jgi:hypothetical protein
MSDARESIINLQMEGSSGSPGPNESECPEFWLVTHLKGMLTAALLDTLYQARKVEVWSYNSGP